MPTGAFEASKPTPQAKSAVANVTEREVLILATLMTQTYHGVSEKFLDRWPEVTELICQKISKKT
jgi:hypothetical protein